MTSESMLSEKSLKNYKGHRIFAIDGTELELANSNELTDYFGKARSTTSPRAKASVLCDVINGSIIHAEIASSHSAERDLAIKHLEYFKKHITRNDIVIFDRGYPSKKLIGYSIKNNITFLMRVSKSFNFEIDNTNEKDFDIYLENDRVRLEIRVIKLVLETGEIETLITNIDRRVFKQDAFMELYFLRWGIETRYDVIKNKLQIEDFSGKTVVSVLQDFYATMYLCNICHKFQKVVQQDFLRILESFTSRLKRKKLQNT